MHRKRGAGRSASSAPGKTTAQRAGPGREHRDGGDEPVSRGAVSPGLPPMRCGADLRSWNRLRPVNRHTPRRDALCAARRAGPAGSGGESADPPGPPPLRLCEGHCASPRMSGWDRCCGPMVPGVWRGIGPRVTSLATPDRNPRQPLVRRPRPHSVCGPIVDRRSNMRARCFRNR
jgi:hypothetical protein